MKATAWTATVDGHEIRAINHYSLLPPRTRETLEIDGVQVAEGCLGWFATNASLNVRADLGGQSRHIEARLGAKVPMPFVGCHILVDGERVGGDVDSAIAAPDAEEAAKEHRLGATGFTGRMLAYGLPFGVIMSLLVPPEDGAWLLPRFLGFTVFYGGGMAAMYWRSLQAQLQGYARCGVR